MSNTWPLDWKNADHYKRINIDTPNNICAWEFLRRNPEYQKDFAEYQRSGELPSLPTPEGPYDSSDMCEWYGLDHSSSNFDPSIDTPPKFYTEEYPYISTRGPGKRLEFPDEFRVVLATEYDYDEQIKKIKAFFVEHRKKQKESRQRKEFYATYLRILDARSSGATAREILDVVYMKQVKEESEVYDTAKKAEELRDGEYIKFVKGTITYPKPSAIESMA